ncbi:MAG TPA: hypothetical protein VNN07_04650 [Candidatus Tectomicrobia bacterium]|nr:hypothetical protein [Candidatus Tectomicrobia bacterium]
MAKVGQFVSDPKVGAYCRITLDNGEKILVNHDKGGFGGGRLTIESSKLMGLRSEQVFTCNLDAPDGRSALATLTHGAQPGSVQATPLGAFVDYVKDCRSIAEVRQKCEALLSGATARREPRGA